MVSGIADEQNREQRAGKRVSDAEINRHGSQSVQGCEIASEERRRPDRDIAGEFIQSDSKTSQFRPDQIDLHDDRHRPGEALIDAKQGVGCDDPFPARRPDEHDGDGQTEQPAEDQHVFAAPGIGKLPGDEIGKRLDDAEARDKRDDERCRSDAELFCSDEWHDRSLDPDHSADKRVDHDKQCELPPIGFEAKRDVARRRCVLGLRGGHPATAAMPVHKWSACRWVSTT